MDQKAIKSAQTEGELTGGLQINVTSDIGFIPIQNATITISYTGTPETVLERLETDSSGQAEEVQLSAPPISYSLTPESPMPYSEYNVTVEAPGYEPVMVSGVEVLPDVTAVQNIQMTPTETAQNEEEFIFIPDHTLYGDYPPKIPEDEIKPMDETGEIVLSRVVIPEYVVVHDGVPSDSSAPNYYVNYKEYIKNVASSEIYATWPASSIYANVLAIMSFTLNRVYTEWYRNHY
ncbi:MAG: carboxypeptidase regulatory-like domain-containing protein [Lachnospiraceae bacterium]|nr:carboxypeptidase regulatory-like domain-containing protein [Lachnospiraceae bacterium]